MSETKIRAFLTLLALFLLLAAAVPALAGGGWTHEELAAVEREYTYTTAEAVAAGRRAAERYGLYHDLLPQLQVSDREFTFTRAEEVERGVAAAEAFWSSWTAPSSR